MTFPRSEYPRDAAGFNEPHEWAGGDFYRDRQSSRARGVVVWSMLSGATAAAAVLLGIGAYVSGKDPVPALVIGAFFASSACCSGLLAVSMAGRLIRGIHDAEIIIASLTYSNELAAQDNARLRVTGAAAGYGGQRRGGAAYPAANIHQFPNNGRKH